MDSTTYDRTKGETEKNAFWLQNLGFPPKSGWFKFSNRNADYCMENGETLGERVMWAVRRNSLGRQSEWAINSNRPDPANPGKYLPLRKSDIATMLHADPADVTRVIQDKVAKGELTDDGKRLRAPANPVPPPRPKDDLPAQRTTDQEWAKLHMPEMYNAYQELEAPRKAIVAQQLAIARAIKIQRQAQEFGSVDQENSRAEEVGHGSNKKTAVVPTIPPLLIKEIDKDIASYEPEPNGGQNGNSNSQFETAIENLRLSGKLAHLPSPNTQTIRNLRAFGDRIGASDLEIIRFLDDKENARTWESWGGAITAFKHDFPVWKRKQPMMAESYHPPPEPGPEDLRQAEEIDRQLAYSEYQDREFREGYKKARLSFEEYLKTREGL